MSDLERVYNCIRNAHPARVTGGQIAQETGLAPDQINELVARLKAMGRIDWQQAAPVPRPYDFTSVIWRS
jgi:hypothetical protein